MEQNFPVTPIFRNILGQAREVHLKFEMRFRILSFPFAIHLEFPEFLVEWKAPLVYSVHL